MKFCSQFAFQINRINCPRRRITGHSVSLMCSKGNKEQLFFLAICFGNSTEEMNSEYFKNKLKVRLLFINSVFNVKVQQQEAERRWEEIQAYLRKRTAEHEAAQQGMYQTKFPNNANCGGLAVPICVFF